MTRTLIRNALLAAIALTMAPAAVQATTSSGVNSSYDRQGDDDDGFDWGWLGLLGLAGLLGLKKNDRDVHVDARRDTRP